MILGATHWERRETQHDLPAPSHRCSSRRRRGRSGAATGGAEGVDARILEAWRAFLPSVDPWLEVVHGGAGDVERVYREVLEGSSLRTSATCSRFAPEHRSACALPDLLISATAAESRPRTPPPCLDWSIQVLYSYAIPTDCSEAQGADRHRPRRRWWRARQRDGSRPEIPREPDDRPEGPRGAPRRRTRQRSQGVGVVRCRRSRPPVARTLPHHRGSRRRFRRVIGASRA